MHRKKSASAIAAATQVTSGARTRSRVWVRPFFAKLANSGNVTAACLHARVKYGVVQRLRKLDPEFARRWNSALKRAGDNIDAEIHRRGVLGVSEPVFHNGKIVSKVRKYSDTLLIFFAKGLMPKKYRDNYTVQHKGKVGSDVNHNYNFDGIDTDTLLKLEEARRSGAGRISEPSRN